MSHLCASSPSSNGPARRSKISVLQKEAEHRSLCSHCHAAFKETRNSLGLTQGQVGEQGAGRDIDRINQRGKHFQPSEKFGYWVKFIWGGSKDSIPKKKRKRVKKYWYGSMNLDFGVRPVSES